MKFPSDLICAFLSKTPFGLTALSQPVSTRNFPFGCSIKYDETGSQRRFSFFSKIPDAFIGLQLSPPNGKFGETQTFPV